MSSTVPDLICALLPLGAHFVAGGALGAVFFLALWRSARGFAEGANVFSVIGLALGRFALLGGALTLASFEGAPRLLAMAAGALVAREAVVRRVKRIAP
jgi:hypothetical protein